MVYSAKPFSTPAEPTTDELRNSLLTGCATQGW